MRYIDYNLLVAIEKGHFEAAKSLLSQGADVNAIADYQLEDEEIKEGHSPLLVAAINNRFEIMALLLKKGANVNYQSAFGNHPTALHQAAFFQHEKCVNLLLQHYADANIPNLYGITALLAVCANNSNESAAIIRLLLDYGAHIDHQNDRGITALMITVEPTIMDINVDCVALLVERGASLTLTNERGLTAIDCIDRIVNPHIVDLITSVKEKQALGHCIDDSQSSVDSTPSIFNL